MTVRQLRDAIDELLKEVPADGAEDYSVVFSIEQEVGENLIREDFPIWRLLLDTDNKEFCLLETND